MKKKKDTKGGGNERHHLRYRDSKAAYGISKSCPSGPPVGVRGAAKTFPHDQERMEV